MGSLNYRFKKMNKKGFIGVAIMIIVFLVVFAIINLVIGKAFGDINEFIQDDDMMSNTSKAVVQDLDTRYDATFDGAFILVFGLLFIMGIVFSWLSDSSPLFMVLAIIFMIFLLLGSMVLSNVWADFTSDDEFAGSATDTPMTNWILSNYLLVSLMMIGVMIFTMVLKSRI